MDRWLQFSYLGPLSAFLSSFTWALGTSCYSRISKNNSPFAINLHRAIVGFPLFTLTTFVLAGGFSAGIQAFTDATFSNWSWLVISSLASYGLGDVIFLWASQSIGISAALAIACCYPIWTVLAGVIFLGHVLTAVQILGLFLTVGGVVTVVLQGETGNAPKNLAKAGSVGSDAGSEKAKAANRSVMLRGVLQASVASLLWAFNSFALAQGGGGIMPSVGNSMRLFAVLICTPFLSLLFAPKAPIFLPTKVFTKYLWVFFVEGFLGATFILYGLSHSPLALGVALTSLSPVISVPVAVMLGIEKFSIPKTVGVCIVVLGILLLLKDI